ncbi:DUF6973 domain-containing protein [Fibrella forsythiae]|uniref:DUF6973 domain-containing protein n=1 Tax=Fibrella forsythiae TaxID=2817061 RepID=A0ABS3JFL7_9BACT|nr:hypothetical protein [Fibrella forsythiae]MBO0948089.1 hypothetical protein [Fibrella forsythiae]
MSSLTQPLFGLIQTTISHFDLPPLHEESCFQSYLVTTYEDGHEDWDPIGAPWCVDASLQQSDDPTRISGGSDGNPNPVEPPHANDCEISYLAEMAFEGRNPLHAAVCMLLNASDVVDRIFDRFPNFTDQDSEPLNAVKHAMFIAFNACDFGDFDAGNMATLHENCGGIPPARAQSAAMDLFNNNVGLAIQAQIGCANRDNLAEEIFNAFRTGRLHKINGQPTP